MSGYKYMVGLWITLMVLLSSGSAVAQEQAEQLSYEVTWGYSTVASLSLQFGCARKTHRPALMRASSTGVADQIHAFEIRLDSFMAADASHSLEGRTAITEEGHKRTFRSRFSLEKPSVTTVKHFRKTTSEYSYELPGRAHDLLSWMAALRREKLSSGASYQYVVWDGWKLARIEATVAGREPVWTPLGIHDAYEVALTRVRLHHKGEKRFTPRHAPEKIGKIWLSDSEGHLPVAMDYNAPVGTARVILSRVSRKACRR